MSETESDKKKKITLMMKPALKREIDFLAVERGDRPCDTLEYLVNLGLEKLAEISGQSDTYNGRISKLAEAGTTYRVGGTIKNNEV